MRGFRRRERVRPLVLVALGGSIGAALRHGVAVGLPSAEVGTLVVNVVGSFLLGLVLAVTGGRDGFSPGLRLFVGTGVLSSFTTYSAFAVQTAGLSPRLAAAFVVGNYGLALLAVVLAHALVGWSR